MILAIGRNPLVRIFALLVILYSFGVPMPVLGRNPCTQWHKASFYVALPREMCYDFGGGGWVDVP